LSTTADTPDAGRPPRPASCRTTVPLAGTGPGAPQLLAQVDRLAHTVAGDRPGQP
jgi:hypothetical protein